MYQEGLYVYGSGECDQLGNIKNKDGDFILESKIPRYLPIKGITEIEKIYKISCGGMHTLLLTSQGNIYSWGCSDGGTLGRDGTDNIPTKVNINIPIEGISAGDCHSIAYNDKLNKIYFWGTFRNSQGEIGEHITQPMEINLQLINNEDIVKVISGNNHVVILTEQGHVYAFGNKEFGQTGIDISKIDNNQIIENEHLIPNKIKGENITNIYTGGNHSFLIQNDRRKIFKSWGCNTFGQLGINNNKNQFEPQEVKFPEENIEIISCTGGDFHTLALTNNYHIYSWGKNDESQCGLPIINERNPEGQEIICCISKPTRVDINENDIKEIDSYGNYNFAYNPESGKAYSWGFGASYVLGNKEEENEEKPFEINKEFFKNMRLKNISLGNQHVCLELEKYDKSYVKTAFEFDYAANGFSIRNKVVKRKGENYNKKERTNKKRRKGSKVDNDDFVITEKKTRKKRRGRRRRKDKGKEIESDEEYVYDSEEEDEENEDEEEEEEEDEEEEEIEKKKRRKRRNYGKKSVSKSRRKKKENEDIEEDEEENEELETKRKKYGKRSVSKTTKKTKENDDENIEKEELKTKRKNYGKRSVSKSRKKINENDNENIEIKLLKEEINLTPVKKETKKIKTTGAESNRKTNEIKIEKIINIKTNLTGKDNNILNEINEEDDDSNTSETVGIVKDVKLIRYTDFDKEKNDKIETTVKKRTYKKRSKSKSNVKTKENKTERKSNRKYTNTSRSKSKSKSKSKSNVKNKGKKSVKK